MFYDQFMSTQYPKLYHGVYDLERTLSAIAFLKDRHDDDPVWFHLLLQRVGKYNMYRVLRTWGSDPPNRSQSTEPMGMDRLSKRPLGADWLQRWVKVPGKAVIQGSQLTTRGY